MNDSFKAADILHEAAELNLNDPLRRGSLLEFPNYGQLVMTGDLHGHSRNFEKLQRYCDLEHFPPRHVILHEIIHQEVVGLEDTDQSFRILIEAAAWKCAYPDQVHFLQSNHELAQLTRHEITKAGRVVTVAFEDAVCDAFGPGGQDVMIGVNAYIKSLPLAARTQNRVFLSHSLPAPRELPGFDATVLSRVPTDADLGDRGSVHSLVWGRYHTAPALAALAEMLDVDVFICGHQPQEMGYDVWHDRLIILASDHNHGVFLPFDLSKPQTAESLERHIRPFAGIE